MSTQPQDTSGTDTAAVIDYDAWRKRIRESTFSNYHKEMGRAIQREGNLEAAAAAYRRALEISPDCAGAAHGLIKTLNGLGKAAEAAAVDAEMRARNPAYTAEALLEEGESLLERREIGAAIELFNQALSGDPRLAHRVADALRSAAKLVVGTHGQPEGLSFIQRALALLPTSGDLQGSQADLLIAMKRLPEAEAACSRTDRLGVEDIASQGGRSLNFADLLMRNNRLTDAIGVLEKACAFLPKDAPLHNRLGFAYMLRGEYGKAEEALAKAIASNPQFFIAKANLATLHLVAGRAVEAIGIQQDVCRNSPNDAAQLSVLGLMQLSAGQHDLALDTLRRALALAPQDQWCMTNVGLALQVTGDALESVRLHSSALAKAEDSWTATNLGLALEALGREQEAVEAFQRASRNTPTLLHYQAKLRPWAYERLVARFTAIGVDFSR
ncbi:tetratricopeptide repeat protein [Azospirillum soli]|uniref:tetratricopeptide repeat protein n=1 Tax=Azospirillum soli TaxID=1304799 RepID=UPI001AEA78B6|nr:tetratricopeptide repeat protein [Azospirillum soli]MBP2316251.1 tetratricopeptide (TPR) repeat protein [Azospirillum soli]